VGEEDPDVTETQDRQARWSGLRGEISVLPSLLSADFARLAEEISTMTTAGARILHLDVMDGHFVPNITFGPPVVAAIRRHTDLWLDAHLMIADPASFIEPFAKAGADSITIHAETGRSILKCREIADRCGVPLGIALRPGTRLDEILASIGEHFDLILIMTVEPGFGGQSYLPGSSERIRAAARFARSSPRRPVLEVDGGVRPGIAGEAVQAGAQWLVAGNAIFRNPLPIDAFRACGRVRSAATSFS
jgi:ribulose-phosphate 3-epimerase